MMYLLPWLVLSQVVRSVDAQAATATSNPMGEEIQLFIDNPNPDAHWAASILNDCDETTTYVLSCTSAANNGCGVKTATVTYGSDFYLVTTPAIVSETSATVTESCHLDTLHVAAQCEATIVASQFGNSITNTIAYNLTGPDYRVYDVLLTAGASKTMGGGVCAKNAASQSAARPAPREDLVVGFFAVVAAVSFFGLLVL